MDRETTLEQLTSELKVSSLLRGEGDSLRIITSVTLVSVPKNVEQATHTARPLITVHMTEETESSPLKR